MIEEPGSGVTGGAQRPTRDLRELPEAGDGAPLEDREGPEPEGVHMREALAWRSKR